MAATSVVARRAMPAVRTVRMDAWVGTFKIFSFDRLLEIILFEIYIKFHMQFSYNINMETRSPVFFRKLYLLNIYKRNQHEK